VLRIGAHEIVGVLQGAVSEALDMVTAEKARGFSASILVIVHWSNGCEMHSLGSFTMVRDLAKFPPGPAQVPTGTQRLAEEQRDAPQVRPHEEAPSPSHAAPPAIPRYCGARHQGRYGTRGVHRRPRRRCCRLKGRRVGADAQQGEMREEEARAWRVVLRVASAVESVAGEADAQGPSDKPVGEGVLAEVRQEPARHHPACAPWSFSAGVPRQRDRPEQPADLNGIPLSDRKRDPGLDALGRGHVCPPLH
jgi:hypothetical protein